MYTLSSDKIPTIFFLADGKEYHSSKWPLPRSQTDNQNSNTTTTVSAQPYIKLLEQG